MRKIIFILIFIQLTLLSQENSEKPNIVVFIADDAGMDFGCYGNDAISTPNIDKLAAEGLTCTNAFLTSPQCSPSRTSMLSGQFAHTIGTEDLHTRINDTTKLAPFYLKKAGYYTGFMKKGHFGENGLAQFDWHDINLHTSKGWYRNAVNYFEEFVQASSTQPFFLWVGFTDPHRPYAEEHSAEDRAPKVNDPKDVIIPPYLVDSEVTRGDLADYYDEITRMDNHIGGMVEVLRKKNLLDNTIIIFLSDNGMPFPRAKGTLYDSGIKTPLIFYWKDKIESNTTFDGLVSTIDLIPTILELANVNRPIHMYGNSIQNIFYDQSIDGRDHIFAERNWHNADEHMRAIRTSDHLLILNSYIELPHGTPTDLSSSPSWFELMKGRDNGTLTSAQEWLFITPRYAVELYDVKNDHYQVNNLSGREEYLNTGKNLIRTLVQWMQETRDHPPNERRKHDVVDRISGYPIANGPQRDFYKNYWSE